MTENSETSEATTEKPVFVPMEVVQRTDVGRVRSENQDFAITTTPEESAEHGYLLVVADGMGGHRGGATASRMAGNIVREEFLTAVDGDETEILHSALVRANEKIFQESEMNPGLKGMGTTCSSLLVRRNLGWIAHIGDSRIYRVRDGEIDQMTMDHSLVATMVREGLITEEEAETHPRRNVLQRSMGVSAGAEVDVYEPFEIIEGDTFILCSDGLHGLVKNQELMEITYGNGLDHAIDRFIELALERGAHDNVTVVMARAGEPSDELPSSQKKPRTVTVRKTESAGTTQSGTLLRWLLVGLLAVAATGAVVLSLNQDAILRFLQTRIEGR